MSQHEREAVVSRYLRFLQDPASILDSDEIGRAEAAAEAARTSDPVEYVKLLSRLENLRSADGSEAQRNFISVAKAWAAEAGVTSDALRRVGVPADVLAEAGLVTAVGGRRRRSAAGGRRGGSRGPGVSSAVVRENVLSRSGPFTLKAVMDDTGASMMTVRKTLRELAATGEVAELGADPASSGKGRAPNLYQRN